MRECVSYRFPNCIIHRLCHYDIGEGNGYGHATAMMYSKGQFKVDIYKRKVSLKWKAGDIKAVGMRGGDVTGFGIERYGFKTHTIKRSDGKSGDEKELNKKKV